MLKRLLPYTCLLLVAHCNRIGTETDNPANTPAGVELLRSDKAHQSLVQVPAGDQRSLREGNLEFAGDLFRSVAGAAAADTNLLLCPYNISRSVAMLQAGASGETEAQIATAMHFGLDQAALHPAMNQLSQDLSLSAQHTDVRLEGDGALWLARGFAPQSGFLDLLSQHYDTGVYSADFAGEPDVVRRRINEWVAARTERQIPELFDLDSITTRTVLALTTTAYLSAPWQFPFRPEDTRPDEFTLSDGKQVTVQMMDQKLAAPFAFGVDWRAVELPYRDSTLSMVLVLPNPGELGELETKMGPQLVEEILAALDASQAGVDSDELRLVLPRFAFDSQVDLRLSLDALGVAAAFEGYSGVNGGFSGIDSAGPIHLSGMLQRASISVDEAGTLAAAGLGAVASSDSATPQLWFDRPFVFFIWDRGSGTLLFAGRFARPEGSAMTPSTPPELPADSATICSILADCPARSTPTSSCQVALETQDAAQVEQCADCFQALYDRCGAQADCTRSPNACDAAACEDHCPKIAF